MKKFFSLFFLSFVVSNLSYGFTCKNTGQETKETVVMVDLNFVYGEVKSAAKAACDQGKEFVILPYGMKIHKELGELREVVYRQQNYYKNNNCDFDSNLRKCTDIRNKLIQAEDKLYTRKSEIAKSGKSDMFKDNGIDFIKDGFKKLSNKNAEIHSIIMSGHDGSGSLDGMAGYISKRDLLKILNENFDDKENLLKNLNSIYLWGCYTATRGETGWWSEHLPQISLVAGFHGSGPSIGKQASNDILYDLLTSEVEIKNLCDGKEIENKLMSLKGLKYLFSGIYVKSCNEDQWYLSRKKVEILGTSHSEYKTQFGEAGKEICVKPELLEKAKNYIENFNDYFDGIKPIPKDTNNGPLRKIYNFSRDNEHCLDSWKKLGLALNPDNVALLLFYDGVKANFYNSFKDLIIEATDAINSLPLNEVDLIGKDLDFKSWLIKKTKLEISKFLNPKELADLQNFVLQNREALNRLPKTKEEFVMLSRKEINRYNQMLHELTTSSLSFFPSIEQKTSSLYKLKKALNIYAYSLDTNCMNMLSWHEEFDGSLYFNRSYNNGCNIYEE